MAVIFFWRGDYYFDDILDDPETDLPRELNQDNVLMSRLRKGDHVWAFTRRPDKAYVLALDLIVEKTKENRPSDANYRYGRYRAIGHKGLSRYFDVIDGPDAEPLIRSLSFHPKARSLGHSFQGLGAVKLLTFDDDHELQIYSSRLRIVPRATTLHKSAWLAMRRH